MCINWLTYIHTQKKEPPMAIVMQEPPPRAPIGIKVKPTAERFLDMTVEADGCLEWTGATDRHGYGRFCIDGKRRSYLSNRSAWELFVGPIPDGMYVLHTCDNRKCVRVEHLYLGDHAQNMADRKARKGY
jgi:hypothetical protein